MSTKPETLNEIVEAGKRMEAAARDSQEWWRAAAELGELVLTHGPHLAAELLRLRAERTWQPIDKAPQDGTEFLGYWDNDDLHVVSIRAGQCYRQMDRDAWAMPTLWMPLPELPDEARELAEILKPKSEGT
jgi:hypothetical protein